MSRAAGRVVAVVFGVRVCGIIAAGICTGILGASACMAASLLASYRIKLRSYTDVWVELLPARARLLEAPASAAKHRWRRQVRAALRYLGRGTANSKEW
jgi:hypothetical protein